MTNSDSYPTGLGSSDERTISLLGQSLAEDMIGRVGFGELALWMLNQRRPNASEVRIFEAVLVALADHGFTPTAIVSRLTLLSAPDSIQGAMAAGLLGGGSRFLGVTEDTGRFLHRALVQAPLHPTTENEWDEIALRLIQDAKRDKLYIPGLGHPVHKEVDPRTPVLMDLCREEGLYGDHLSLFAAIGRVHAPVLGRQLPLNGAGVCGAALCDLGIPVEVLRGVSLLARSAGLLGQIAEELRNPIGMDIYLHVEHGARYEPSPFQADQPFESKD